MKYVTFLDILLWSVIFCFVLAVIVQAVWILIHREQKRPIISKFFLGMGITGVCSGVIVAGCLFILLPKVYIVGADDYEVKRFISKEWSSQVSRKYIDNQSGEILYLEAVGYGTKQNVSKRIQIPVGAYVECEHSIEGYNTTPPTSISSKSSGAVRWYLYSASKMPKKSNYYYY